jgi:hypothetical protein
MPAGDAGRGIDAEATGRLPGEHIGDGGLVEEFAPPEEAENAAAHHLLKPLDVAGAGITGLVEILTSNCPQGTLLPVQQAFATPLSAILFLALPQRPVYMPADPLYARKTPTED